MGFLIVAKRSVRRARQRERQRGEEEPQPHPVTPAGLRTRPFWLGALAAATLLIPLAILAVVITGGGDDKPPAAAEATLEAGAAKYGREFRERDRQTVEDLTRRMARMLVELDPAVRGLAKTVPPESKRFGPMADSAAVNRWSRTVRDAAKYFRNAPSGGTESNGARIGFAAAVDGLIGAIETYRIALADPGHRLQLLERVRAQRDLAVQAWFAAGIQLDAVNHKYGLGHNHLYLAAEGTGGRGAPDG
jgi:hypothetical protein